MKNRIYKAIFTAISDGFRFLFTYIKSFPYYNSIVCQLLAAGQWLSPGTPVSSTNKTDLHDITEILLKVALNTLTLQYHFIYSTSSVKWEE